MPLFWTQFFGAFNDNVLKNALVLLITYQAANVMGVSAAKMVSLSGGIFILPFFLFSATAGQLADKFEKRLVIRWIKFTEVMIMILATVGFVTTQFEFLLIVLFMMGMHSTFFGPLKYSILPQILHSDELVGGNALVESGTFLAILLGTIVGGELIGVPGKGPAAVSIALLIFSLIGFTASFFIPKTPISDPTLKVQWNPFPPTLQILRYTKENFVVFNSILGISWFWFFGGALLSLFPPFCKDLLHTNESGVTLLLSVFSIGICLGSLLSEKMSHKQVELGLVPLGSIGMTLFTLDLFFAGLPSSPVTPGHIVSVSELFQNLTSLRILFDLFMLAIFGGLFTIPLYTLIQDRSEPSHRSRIIAGNNIVNAIFMVVAAIANVVMLSAGLTIPQIFAALALMNAAVAIYIYRLVPEFFLRFIAWVLARFIYSLQVTGREHIPEKGGVVLVCNHVSFVDWLIIFAAIKRPCRFVMDHHFAQGFFLKSLFRQAKVIPIAQAKENPEILAAAFRKIAEELRAGEVVCLFPEGTITRDGQLNPFRTGIEKIIQETPVPVVPMALNGLWKSLFSRNQAEKRNFPWLFWKPISLSIGRAVPPQQVTAAHLQEQVSLLQNG